MYKSSDESKSLRVQHRSTTISIQPNFKEVAQNADTNRQGCHGS